MCIACSTVCIAVPDLACLCMGPNKWHVLVQVACVSEQEKLAGIAVGGWIAISALAGICLGVIVTLVAQCCWFNKQLAQAPVKVGSCRHWAAKLLQYRTAVTSACASSAQA